MYIESLVKEVKNEYKPLYGKYYQTCMESRVSKFEKNTKKALRLIRKEIKRNKLNTEEKNDLIRAFQVIHPSNHIGNLEFKWNDTTNFKFDSYNDLLLIIENHCIRFMDPTTPNTFVKLAKEITLYTAKNLGGC